jgi:fatty-acyl-CoA synthase
MDAQGRTVRVCGQQEIGMLQVSGPGAMPGFVNSSHERGARTEDGWIISGDLGRVDEDGFVFVTGRAKDVIIRGGHNIDPALIEEPLMKYLDVQLAAAVGRPDAYAGEVPIVYVQIGIRIPCHSRRARGVSKGPDCGTRGLSEGDHHRPRDSSHRRR